VSELQVTKIDLMEHQHRTQTPSVIGRSFVSDHRDRDRDRSNESSSQLDASRLGTECILMARKQLNQAEAELETTVVQLSHKDQKITALHGQIVSLQSQLIELERENQRLQGDQEELEILREMVVRLQAELAKLRAQSELSLLEPEPTANDDYEHSDDFSERAESEVSHELPKRPSHGQLHKYAIRLAGWQNKTWRSPITLGEPKSNRYFPVNILYSRVADSLQVEGPMWLLVGAEGVKAMYREPPYEVAVEFSLGAVVRYSQDSDPDRLTVDVSPDVDPTFGGTWVFEMSAGRAEIGFDHLNRAMQPFLVTDPYSNDFLEDDQSLRAV
jgi:hypothetical protein